MKKAENKYLVMGCMNLGGETWRPLRLSRPTERKYHPEGELLFTGPVALFPSLDAAKKAIKRTQRGWAGDLFRFVPVRCREVKP